MNILNILTALEKVDAEISEKANPRRAALKDLFEVGKKVSIAALPLALSNVFHKVNAQTTTNQAIIDELNLLLAVQYMQVNFYDRALHPVTTPILPIPTADRSVLVVIQGHERTYLNFLIQTITGLGGTARTPMLPGMFNYGRLNANVTSNYETFLRTACVIEDMGVRVYKSQISVMFGNSNMITNLARIHAVQARHSAQLRLMVNRMQIVTMKLTKPWPGHGINDDNTDYLVPTDAYNDSRSTTFNNVYVGENKTLLAGIELKLIGGMQEATQGPAAQAIDELYVTAAAAKAAVNIFIPVAADQVK